MATRPAAPTTGTVSTFTPQGNRTVEGGPQLSGADAASAQADFAKIHFSDNAQRDIRQAELDRDLSAARRALGQRRGRRAAR